MADDLPYTLTHTTPCIECPFRKTSIAGWLGNLPIAHYVGENPHQDVVLPCHMTAGRPRHKIGLCAGLLSMLKNQCKTPRDPELANASRRVGPNVGVFAHRQEFIAHHGSDTEQDLIDTIGTIIDGGKQG